MKSRLLLSLSLLGSITLAQCTSNQPTIWEIDPHDVRKQINEKIMSIPAEQPEVYSSKDLTIEREGVSVPLRIYTPDSSSKELPIILFIHGGAWVAGSLDTHDNLARYLCRGAQAVVVSVGYLNSPEGKFPLPLEQCYQALLWTVEHASELRGRKEALAVVGDSAGGNFTAALCLLARDRSGPPINLQVLINPSPDLTGGGTLERKNDKVDIIRWYATQYLANPADANNPYVSPILAKDLSRLPEALVLLAEKDDLRADGQKYADRLRAAGVRTNIYTQWDIGHLAGSGARASSQAQESLDVAVAALRGAFRRSTLPPKSS
ncbi:MAG: alpha/beta hydrolase [Chlamydiales bacterium]|nr:alpha/beta hydrolase [Chlamydiales bacterium]